MENSKQIKIGAIISYLSLFFNILAGIIYTPWMIRHIGMSNYGLYILVTSFISYFLMDFGLGQAIARYISKYRAEQNQTKINQLLGITSKLYLAINAAIFVVLIVLYFFIENIFLKLNAAEIVLFKEVYLIAGAFSLISFPFLSLDGVLIAFEKFIVLKSCEIISKVATISLMIFAILLGYQLFALILVNAIVGLSIIVIKTIYIYKKTKIRVAFSYSDSTLLKEIFKFSIWTTVIAIAQRLLINIAPVILGIVSGTSQIAVFSIAIIIEGYVWTLAHALNGLFLPKVTQLHNLENNVEEVTKLMIKVGRFQLFLMGLVFIGIITLGKPFIQLWMGTQFADAYLVMLFLVLPGFVTLTQEIAQTYLVVVNELKYRAIIFISASIISVLLSFFLAPIYGALGCAIGIFTATILCHVIGMNYIYLNILKLNIYKFFNQCFGSMILPICLSLTFGFFLNQFLVINSWFMFIFAGILLVFFYGIVCWFLGIKNEEKQFLLLMLTKKKS